MPPALTSVHRHDEAIKRHGSDRLKIERACSILICLAFSGVFRFAKMESECAMPSAARESERGYRQLG
jgi:hypothetical protein